MAAPDTNGSDPLVNRIIEGYEFIRRLGEGSYGMVYLARHPRIKDRLVAVKYIKFTNPREAQKVAREIEILARLKHPNVVDIYDAHRFDNYHLIIMELVRGGSLETSLKQIKGLLDLNFVFEGVEQLAFALGYVHDQRILHLDLKPGNVLLDPVAQGQMARFILTDFGIAQIVSPESAMSANFVGTPMYMSPEHFGFGDSTPDHRSDIYSLGCILYELVVGHVPFQSNQLLDVLNMHAYSQVPLASASVAGIPPALDNVILRALAKSPEDRFQSAHQMGNALKELRLGSITDMAGASFGPRLSGQALGQIAQAGAEALDVIDLEHPAHELSGEFSLVIMKPDGSQNVVAFERESIIAGRDKAVDLPLEQKTISRRHVQIDHDRRGNVFVTDLQSVNGTYLDGVRLVPQERVTWKPDQFLQIQGFLLGINGLGISGSQPLILATEQVVSLLNRAQEQNKKPTVRLYLSRTVVLAELGKPETIEARVEIENGPPATYELRAKPGPGIDERWYTLPASQKTHDKSESTTLTFSFIVNMPQFGTIGDKIYEIALQVVADNADIPTSYQVLKVRVVPFTRFTIALQPSEVSHNRRRRADLLIANIGNHPETFSFEIEAPDTLKITPQSPQVVIDPGEEERVRLKFKPARNARRLRTRLVYSVIVNAATGLSERANGHYIFPRHVRVPTWLLIVWALGVFVLARLVLLGVPISQQLSEYQALVQYLVLKIRGG